VILNYFLHLISVLFLLPVLVLFVQIFSSLKKEKLTCSSYVPKDLSFVILIPAHNEEDVIAKTLISIKEQVSKDDRIIVIADNCSDDTVRIVNEHGVEVVERINVNELGKGFALGFGINHIVELGYKLDVLVVLDADCVVSSGEIRELAAKCMELNRPTQALYLMNSHRRAGIAQKLAEFAWVVKNKIRPLGYRNLNLPCQLTGSGMAFPWSIVGITKFESANIVEDLELGIEYAIEGHPPSFFPNVVISSYFPIDKDGEKSQRKRWEHGHLATIMNYCPRLVKNSVSKCDVNSAALAVDLMVPPLALLTISLIILTLICLGYALIGGGTSPLISFLVLGGVFGGEILVAWYFYGRDILGIKQLLYVPFYILRKVPLYLAFLVKRQTQWVKTPRKTRSEKDNQ